MQFTSLNTLGFADIPPSQMSAATTFASTVQQMTMGMGVAAGAIALRIAALLRHGSGQPSDHSGFSPRIRLYRPDRIDLQSSILSNSIAAAGAVVSGHAITRRE